MVVSGGGGVVARVLTAGKCGVTGVLEEGRSEVRGSPPYKPSFPALSFFPGQEEEEILLLKSRISSSLTPNIDLI
jgi:hypothetical protein